LQFRLSRKALSIGTAIIQDMGDIDRHMNEIFQLKNAESVGYYPPAPSDTPFPPAPTENPTPNEDTSDMSVYVPQDDFEAEGGCCCGGGGRVMVEYEAEVVDMPCPACDSASFFEAEGELSQGYDDRLDESLGRTNGRKSHKRQSYRGRRDESKGMEKTLGRRAYSRVGTMDRRRAESGYVGDMTLDDYEGIDSVLVDRSSYQPSQDYGAEAVGVMEGVSLEGYEGVDSVMQEAPLGHGAPQWFGADGQVFEARGRGMPKGAKRGTAKSRKKRKKATKKYRGRKTSKPAYQNPCDRPDRNCPRDVDLWYDSLELAKDTYRVNQSPQVSGYAVRKYDEAWSKKHKEYNRRRREKLPMEGWSTYKKAVGWSKPKYQPTGGLVGYYDDTGKMQKKREQEAKAKGRKAPKDRSEPVDFSKRPHRGKGSDSDTYCGRRYEKVIMRDKDGNIIKWDNTNKHHKKGSTRYRYRVGTKEMSETEFRKNFPRCLPKSRANELTRSGQERATKQKRRVLDRKKYKGGAPIDVPVGSAIGSQGKRKYKDRPARRRTKRKD